MKKLLIGLLLITLFVIQFGCKKDSDKSDKDTRLIFIITLNGSAVSGCRVEVYGSSYDQTNKTNMLSYATSGSEGKVTFTNCSSTVYYVDFVYNDVLFYSDQTNTLTLNDDNTYNVTLYSMILTLNNATYTPIKITVDGTTQQTIAVGSSKTYTLPDATSVHIVAETNEVFTNQNQLGRKVTWDTSISTPYNSNSVNLNVGSSICYFRIQNSGTYTLGPIYFNYGNSYQYTVNTTLPTGGSTYNLGYYEAISGGTVRAYYYPSTSSYTYWTAGTHFTYPNTVNQLITLTNTYKGISTEESGSIATSINDLNSLIEYKPFNKVFNVDSNTQQIDGKIAE